MAKLKFIDRQSAISTLTSLILLAEKGVFSAKITNDLEEIVYCISAEEQGFHTWDADITECALLDADPSEFERERNRIMNLQKKYAFRPAPYELVDSPLGEEYCKTRINE